jgi:hypothetical protein
MGAHRTYRLPGKTLFRFFYIEIRKTIMGGGPLSEALVDSP